MAGDVVSDCNQRATFEPGLIPPAPADVAASDVDSSFMCYSLSGELATPTRLKMRSVPCSPLLQIESALKALSVLLNLCEAAPQTPHIAPVRAQALALFTQLVLQERGVVSIAPALEVASEGLESVAALHCSLALAQFHLSQRKVTPLYQRMHYRRLGNLNN